MVLSMRSVILSQVSCMILAVELLSDSVHLLQLSLLMACTA